MSHARPPGVAPRERPVVVTAGLTPAWQRLCVLDALHMGEVNRTSEIYPCASGKAINAGIALRHLGGDTVTVCPLGGATGDMVEAQMRSLGLGYRRVDVAQPTRVCYTLIVRGGATTEIVEDADPMSEEEVEAFGAAYLEVAASADIAVVTGSLPRGVPASFYRDLLGRTRCPVILDARGPELLAALDQAPLVVKPNRPELAQTLGLPIEDDDAIVRGMHALAERGAQWVVVSDGDKPLLVLGEGRVRRVLPPKITPVNPIASGDCLAAGLAWALARGCTMLDALRLGVAAASANAARILPGRLDAIDAHRVAETIPINESP